jgi:hypothetical protein
VLLLTLAHWAILALRLPVFTSLPWWFWDFSERPLGALWLAAPLAALGALAVLVALRSSAPAAARAAVLIAIGFAWQQGFGLLEGRGLDGVRDRIVWSGHAQFARAAVREESAAAIVRDYESQAPREAYGKYAASKPPGTLLLYVWTERIARRLHPDAGDPLERLQTTASLLWPLVCYVVLLPMMGLARRSLHPEAGPLAGALYLFVPSVTLMTLHTDQTFYPLLAVIAVWLAALAGDRRSAVLAGAAGAWLYLALFFSFGLVAVAPLAAAQAVALSRERGARLEPRRLAKLALGAAAGFGASDGILRAAFGYDIAARYRGAMAHHVAWKFGWEWSVSNVASIAWLDTLETVLWLGIPLAALAGAACLRGLRARSLAPAPALGAALAAVFAALLLFSRTKGEVGRLWLFLVPFACLVAADALARMPAARRRWCLPACFALQGGTLLLTKAFQDF